MQILSSVLLGPVLWSALRLPSAQSRTLTPGCISRQIDVMYEEEPLKDYYTLMDIAYIYTWRRVMTPFVKLSLGYGTQRRGGAVPGVLTGLLPCRTARCPSSTACGPPARG